MEESSPGQVACSWGDHQRAARKLLWVLLEWPAEQVEFGAGLQVRLAPGEGTVLGLLGLPGQGGSLDRVEGTSPEELHMASAGSQGQAGRGDIGAHMESKSFGTAAVEDILEEVGVEVLKVLGVLEGVLEAVVEAVAGVVVAAGEGRLEGLDRELDLDEGCSI